MSSTWNITEASFDVQSQHHRETIFTIGNGYLCSRGAFEEGYPDEQRATFIHGIFDDVPIVFTELANAPDWLALQVIANGEQFNLEHGSIEKYERSLDLKTGVLTRDIRWRSPKGLSVAVRFERFASLPQEHLLYLRCQVIPEFDGELEIRAALTGCPDNEGYTHWKPLDQGLSAQDDTVAYLHTRTRATKARLAMAMRVEASPPAEVSFWDAANAPTFRLVFRVNRGKAVTLAKIVGVATSRDTEDPVAMAVGQALKAPGWDEALNAQTRAWKEEWERSDVLIDGDDEAQLAIRFNLFQLLIAAPRHDQRVNIGAKTLSGFAYRGHSFWDTETFMLPVFIHTAPGIARNLLDYRYQRLPAARLKANANGFEGAQFPWESADTGEEVTPRWVPDFSGRDGLVRIWTGDIEIHISADVAYAAHLYWKVTGDDAWFVEKGAELILDTAKFWVARAEWNPRMSRYEYNDVIGPDEYHDHVDNNFFTNAMARWNIRTALDVLEWLKRNHPARGEELTRQLELTPSRLSRWADVIARIFLPVKSNGLIEQFEGYFRRRDVNLAALEPRTISAQALFGIDGCSETQILKQADVLMLQYLLPGDFSEEQLRINYDYYTPRTDYTYGSSLGPSIQAILACKIGDVDHAYEQFMRSAQVDLLNVRGNARDGIHGASAGGTWQALVFGFAGLRLDENSWEVHPCLPKHWKQLRFNFYQRGKLQTVDIQNGP